MILADTYRPLGVVSSILDARNSFRLIGLICVVEFFDAFAGSVSDGREALSIS
jgi:hypothetical protein